MKHTYGDAAAGRDAGARHDNDFLGAGKNVCDNLQFARIKRTNIDRRHDVGGEEVSVEELASWSRILEGKSGEEANCSNLTS